MRRQGTVHQSGVTQTHHLFAYPLESNFSGARYDPALSTYVQHNGLPMCEQQSAAMGASAHKQQVHPISNGAAQNGRHAGDAEAADGRRSGSEGTWWTLLDAAKACATSPPDLSLHKPDFVVRCLGTASASDLSSPADASGLSLASLESLSPVALHSTFIVTLWPGCWICLGCNCWSKEHI